MKTIKKAPKMIFENILTLMDRFPGLLSLLLTLIIVTELIIR